MHLANTQKHPTFGFEAGRLQSGFRYVYPLRKGAQHLGSVETGISFRAISEAMAAVDPGREYLLIIRKESVYRALFADQRVLYGNSPIHDSFLVEDPMLRLPSSPPPLSAQVEAITTLIVEIHTFDERFAGTDDPVNLLIGGRGFPAARHGRARPGSRRAPRQRRTGATLGVRRGERPADGGPLGPIVVTSIAPELRLPVGPRRQPPVAAGPRRESAAPGAVHL